MAFLPVDQVFLMESFGPSSNVCLVSQRIDDYYKMSLIVFKPEVSNYKVIPPPRDHSGSTKSLTEVCPQNAQNTTHTQKDLKTIYHHILREKLILQADQFPQ